MSRANCEQLILKILCQRMEKDETPGNLIVRRRYKKQQDFVSMPSRFAWLRKYTRNKDRQKSQLFKRCSRHRFVTLNNEDNNKSRTTSLQSRAMQSVYYERQHTHDVEIDNDTSSILGDVNLQEKHNRSCAPLQPLIQEKKRIVKTTNETRIRQKFTIFQQKLDIPLRTSTQSKFTPKSFKDIYFKEKKEFQTKKSKVKTNPAQLLTQKVHLQIHLPPKYSRNLTANTYKQKIPRCVKQRSEIPIRPWEHNMESNDENLFEDFDMV